jgi:hypothetical protein
MSSSNYILVEGTLQLLGSPARPAVITATKPGGMEEGEGFQLYVKANATAVRLQHALLTNLAQGSSLFFNDTAFISNSKFFSTSPGGETYLSIYRTGARAAAIYRSLFFRITPSFESDLRGTSFSFVKNRMRESFYAIRVGGFATNILDAGMVTGNDFHAGTNRQNTAPAYAHLFQMTGTGMIPVGGNYWSGGTNSPPLPQLQYIDSPDMAYDFSPALAAPPQDCGPTW